MHLESTRADMFVWRYLGARWMNLNSMNWDVFQLLSGCCDYHRTPVKSLYCSVGLQKETRQNDKECCRETGISSNKNDMWLSAITGTDIPMETAVHLGCVHSCHRPPTSLILITKLQPHRTDFSCFFRSDRGSREGQALKWEAEVLNAGKPLLSSTMEKVQKATTVKQFWWV